MGEPDLPAVVLMDTLLTLLKIIPVMITPFVLIFPEVMNVSARVSTPEMELKETALSVRQMSAGTGMQLTKNAHLKKTPEITPVLLSLVIIILWPSDGTRLFSVLIKVISPLLLTPMLTQSTMLPKMLTAGQSDLRERELPTMSSMETSSSNISWPSLDQTVLDLTFLLMVAKLTSELKLFSPHHSESVLNLSVNTQLLSLYLLKTTV